MRGFGWATKEIPTRQAGPLDAVALSRLRRLDSPTLAIWIDNSLAKIGQSVAASERAVHKDEAVQHLAIAEEEAAACVQALRELAARRT